MDNNLYIIQTLNKIIKEKKLQCINNKVITHLFKELEWEHITGLIPDILDHYSKRTKITKVKFPSVTFRYTRDHYFKYHLKEFTTEMNLPNKLYENIKDELKKQQFTDMSKLTPGILKKVLKELGKKQYYKHIPYIIRTLNGISQPIITKELEIKLMDMFKAIQEPFNKHKSYRCNFFPYTYVLYKFFEILDMKEYCKYCKLLKSIDKLCAIDSLWQKVVQELKWEFIRTI